jgi:hypothetical protein
MSKGHQGDLAVLQGGVGVDVVVRLDVQDLPVDEKSKIRQPVVVRAIGLYTSSLMDNSWMTGDGPVSTDVPVSTAT